ncbi:MAG: 23S rRNA-associated protein [Candidatus Curtissbacteria bacterium GW2011_GWA1_40_9]|uniref:23S rRNA-associated protein n=1 Tax=Candidatus Curtissbacteria bacterium GW2011_GWA1_40_9 TaxID=1618408 RepID=A0A0G0WSC3_9BACT|nr:MAG: 23S rRNA-associated protein [Candidatus Curtissbacteria bacterium GW2011_GWA1_40_9]
MNDFRFVNFKVYNDAKNFYHDIVAITAKFPRPYWELGDQMRRSALSVILNIAEGSAKKSDIDFNRYIKISLGSINECVAGLDVAQSEKLISGITFNKLTARAAEIAKQLGGFSKKLK